jgi:hypothetical protein
MRVIIAGSRSLTDYNLVKSAVQVSRFHISEVVCGGAAGIDTLGRLWGDRRGILVKSFPAKWQTHGRAAGHIRNDAMAKYADALILIWDGRSKGSASMLRAAKKYKLKIFEVIVEGG